MIMCPFLTRACSTRKQHRIVADTRQHAHACARKQLNKYVKHNWMKKYISEYVFLRVRWTPYITMHHAHTQVAIKIFDKAKIEQTQHSLMQVEKVSDSECVYEGNIYEGSCEICVSCEAQLSLTSP